MDDQSVLALSVRALEFTRAILPFPRAHIYIYISVSLRDTFITSGMCDVYTFSFG